MLSVSLLDQAINLQGRPPSETLKIVRSRAILAEQLGFDRFWIAENHSNLAFATPSPGTIANLILAETSSIRVGAGCVLVPYQTPLSVAEEYRTLVAVHGSRVDLALGKGAAKISDEEFEERTRAIVSLARGKTARGVFALPYGEYTPEIWLVTASGSRIEFATQFELPVAFAHFINPDVAKGLLENRGSLDAMKVRRMLAVRVVADRDRGRAYAHAARVERAEASLHGSPLSPLDRVTPIEPTYRVSRRTLYGTPAAVGRELRVLCTELGIQDLMLTIPLAEESESLAAIESLGAAVLDG